MFLESHV